MTTPPPAPSAPPDTDAQWCDLEALVTIHAEHYAAGRQADGETVGGEILDAFRSFRTEVALLTHKIITCGVAASHPDAGLSRRGAYAGAWDSPQAEEVRALRAERDALRRSRQGDPMTTPSLAAIEEWIRNLAEDGTSDSDAAGSLRAAWEALTAERDAARAEVEAVQKDWHQRRDAATAAYLATYDRLQSERDAALSRADEAERARAEGAERDLAQARAEHVNDVACGERRLIRCEEDRDAARARAERLVEERDRARAQAAADRGLATENARLRAALSASSTPRDAATGHETPRTLIVNGTEYPVTPRDANEAIGSLAHFVLWRERYAWTEIDLRDADGASVLPNTRPADAKWPVYVGRPIGHGG